MEQEGKSTKSKRETGKRRRVSTSNTTFENTHGTNCCVIEDRNFAYTNREKKGKLGEPFTLNTKE
jgi:hypothetical protein